MRSEGVRGLQRLNGAVCGETKIVKSCIGRQDALSQIIVLHGFHAKSPCFNIRFCGDDFICIVLDDVMAAAHIGKICCQTITSEVFQTVSRCSQIGRIISGISDPIRAAAIPIRIGDGCACSGIGFSIEIHTDYSAIVLDIQRETAALKSKTVDVFFAMETFSPQILFQCIFTVRESIREKARHSIGAVLDATCLSDANGIIIGGFPTFLRKAEAKRISMENPPSF